MLAMDNTMAQLGATQLVSIRRSTQRAYAGRATGFARRFVSLAIFAGWVAAAPVTAAATLDFKLSPELKGREQRIANQMALSLGLAAPTRGSNGSYSLTVASDAEANTAAIALRERGGVLWAQVAVTEAPLTSKAPETEYHGRMLALTLNNPTTAAATVQRIAAKTGQVLKLKRVTASNRALFVLPAGTTSASLAAVAVAAAADSAVASAERVRVFRHQWIPNDTMYVQQWALGNGVGGIRAAKAWDVTPSGSVAVAIIDTGIRSHPDLDAKRMSGYDMISNTFSASDGDGRDSDPTDGGDFDDALECRSGAYDFISSWHGTHVAGIIAASTNNGDGMAGVAPNARIVPVRALGRCGGTAEDVADAIRWAAGVPVAGVPNNPNPARVLNLSLGGTGPCNSNEQSAVDGALARGAVVVVAAGNDAALASDFSPANCKGVVAVAASNLLGDLSSFSNFGATVSLSAPGGDSGNLPGIISTLNGGITLPGVPSYATYMGTSMAAPHVSGVVALMLTRDPTLTPGQVFNRLRVATRTFPAGADCAAAPGSCGSGLLDAFNAVSSVTSTRAAMDVAATPDRTRLVELLDGGTGRYALISDPIELMEMLGGARGGSWGRTGCAMDTFSFTAQFNVLALAQPVCRARLVNGGAYAYSASTEDCKAYAANPGWAVDGMMFQASFPNSFGCTVGSVPAYEMLRLDTSGYNLRTVLDNAEFNRMVDAGWAVSRIAFCVPD